MTKTNIAIVVHVYYPELWKEIASYLSKIDVPFDLFVTTVPEKSNEVRSSIRAQFPQVVIKTLPNKGMDIVPFLSLIPELVELKYQAVCKLHAKKGESESGSVWRHQLLESLVGSNKVVETISQAFDGQNNLAMVGTGAFYLSAKKFRGGDNKPLLNKLCDILAISSAPKDWGFFAGSMFWVKPNILMELSVAVQQHLELNRWQYKQDGAIEHALERILGLLPLIGKQDIGLLLPTVGGRDKAILQVSSNQLGRYIGRAYIKPLLSQYNTLKDDRTLLLQTGLFSHSSYLKQFPILLGLSVDLPTHYLLIGRFLGGIPHPNFDVVTYLQLYQKYMIEGEDAFLHYIRQKGRQSLLLQEDRIWRNEDIQLLNCSTIERSKKKLELDNYSKEDHEKIIEASGLFNKKWYISKYPDAAGFKNIIHHYCVAGYKENRQLNPLFDPKWYREKYLINNNTDPLLHYLMVGWRKNYNPSNFFDVRAYISKYKNINGNPLSYFFKVGRKLGHKINKVSLLNKHTIPMGESISSQLCPDFSALSDYSFKILQPIDNTYDPESLNIHFVIPDFGVGGGGHMTIFRMVRFLEKFGHQLVIWIYKPSIHKNADDAYDDIIKNYQTIKAKVLLIDLDADITKAQGDVLIATGWDTVWPVMSSSNFKKRFYFVQDYEADFYAKGSRSELAEYTYSLDLDCLCASSWLKKLMIRKYERWAESFDLAFDDSIFFQDKQRKVNNIPRIAFYARIFTERRGVELGILALELLAKEDVQFHVDFYGANLNIKTSSFSCTNHGVKSPEYLAKLYNNCDIGIVFSLTNYSLVPQEMMACGLPIIEYDIESTRAIYPEHVVTFSGPDPVDIKNNILKLINSSSERERQKKMATKWVRQFSWEKSARKIELAIKQRLEKGEWTPIVKKKEKLAIKASIIIPTCNAGMILRTVIESILKQDVPWIYEIIIVDSESNDGSIEWLKSQKISNLNIITVKKADFNHGNTRNYAASFAQGEFIAFITHDAIPADKDWIYNIVTILEHYPLAGGAFGKHIAHDDATFYTMNDLKNHFNYFDQNRLYLSKYTNFERYKNCESWQKILHFYSDNNSCVRKSIFNKIPYRRVKYGEDQLWAKDIIDNGYGKVYAVSAIVKHSHDYDPEETYKRSVIESDFFHFFWKYKMIEDGQLDRVIEDLQQHDMLLGYENGLSEEEIFIRMKNIEARCKGYLKGQNLALSLFSEDNKERSSF